MINEELVRNLEDWIKDYVFNKAKASGVILGMSGGKDSLITAKLCINALGKENVLGIIMPNGAMKDISVAVETCELLEIDYYNLNIENLYNELIEKVTPIISKKKKPINTVTTFNVPPRLRMTTLYAIAGSLNYLVANTSNLSEAMVGYTTKWGDNVGDFAPLLQFTKEEVCEIGTILNLPKHLVYKIPDDGLTGKTDENILGFTYSELNNLIRNGIKAENYEKIMSTHKKTSHKRNKIASFAYEIKNYMEE